MTRPAGHPRVVLSIAGSDPSGGAGIQADLKTFAALGAYGCAVITSLTAQSTLGVSGVFPIPARFVREQLDALFADVAVDAVKIGMLANADIAREVAEALDAHRLPIVVLDPVMVATSGDRLLAEDAEAVVREQLLPRADIITPNLPEAAALLGVPPADTPEQCREQARALVRAGARRVLLKGGHLLGDGDPGGESATDYLTFPDGRDRRSLSAAGGHAQHPRHRLHAVVRTGRSGRGIRGCARRPAGLARRRQGRQGVPDPRTAGRRRAADRQRARTCVTFGGPARLGVSSGTSRWAVG